VQAIENWSLGTIKASTPEQSCKAFKMPTRSIVPQLSLGRISGHVMKGSEPEGLTNPLGW